MPNKRDSSKQRRARQNRAQRAALEARRKAAQEPKPVRPAPSSSAADVPTSDATASPRKGRFARGPAERAPRPGDVALDVSTLEGSWISKRAQVPGGRQILFAVPFAMVGAFLFTTRRIPDPAFEDATDAPLVPVLDVIGPAGAFAYLGLPLVATLVAAALALHPNRRRIWMNCAIFLGAVVVLLAGFEYLFAAGYLAFGIWKAKRVEGPLPRRGAKPASSADDEA